MDLWLKIETCDKHQSLNLQRIHVVDHLGSHLGWQPLTKISKLTTMAPPFNIEACNKHQTPACSHGSQF